MTTNNKFWLTATEAAKVYGTNRMRIWRAVRSGDIQTTQNGHGKLLYAPDIIKELKRPRKKPDLNHEWVDPVALFWSMVEKTDGCWLWKDGNGGYYGSFRANGETYIAHRFSYELAYGPIPEGHYICHRCDVPPCVRPDHLFAGTPGDNTRDAMHKGRLAKGVKIGISRLDPQKVKEIRQKYIPREYGYRKLADEYGVTYGAIQAVIRGRTWRHV